MATTAAVPALVGLAEAFAAQGARRLMRSPRAVRLANRTGMIASAVR